MGRYDYAMSLLKEELKSVTVNDLFLKENTKKNLSIPSYQRPYKWQIEEVNNLINDILFEERHNNNLQYRVGSIILYKNPETTEYEIVDGQQRLITMTLILLSLNKTDLSLENIAVDNSFTRYNLWHNYEYIKSRSSELKSIEDYVLYSVEFVQIVLDDLSESFQFFDSANTRGRDLYPHDLLKAYHLRAMSEYKEFDRLQVINIWEEMNQKELAEFFSNNLFKTISWAKGKQAYHFKTRDIELFKGVSEYDSYHFSTFIMRGVSGFGNHDRVFQLSQNFINGEPFFYEIHYYKYFYLEMVTKLRSFFPSLYDFHEMSQRGNSYILTMFENASFYFANKFGIEELNHSIARYFFLWAFSLRLQQQNIRIETIDKYARSVDEPRYKNLKNGQINLFQKITDARTPQMVVTSPLKKINISEIRYQRGQKAIKGDIINPVIDLFNEFGFIYKESENESI